MLTQQAKRLKTLEEEKKFHTEVIKNQSQAIADMATRMPSTAKAANVPETASEPGPSEVNAMPEERYDMDDQILQDDDCKDLMQKIMEMKKSKNQRFPFRSSKNDPHPAFQKLNASLQVTDLTELYSLFKGVIKRHNVRMLHTQIDVVDGQKARDVQDSE